MGAAESNPVRNMDKRTARREYRKEFSAAIMRYRRLVGEGAEQPEPEVGRDAAVRVCIRKRPIFDYELENQEFDVITCVGQSTLVVHDARMHPDMRRQFLHHHEFHFDNVFNENATNAQVYEAAALPLVRFVMQGGYSTCLMYGQTGSGSNEYRMRNLLSS
jgi:hypothetical protein